METTNIYDFLQLLSLIKIRLNMDLGGPGGGEFGTIHFSFYFVISNKMEKGLETKTKVKGKKHTQASVLSFLFDFFKLGFN